MSGDRAWVLGSGSTGLVALLLLSQLGGMSCSPAEEPCENSCEYAFDGECDDGRPGSAYSVCSYGTDGADCGGCGSPSGPSPSGAGTGSVTFWADYAQCGYVTFDFCVSLNGSTSCASPLSSAPSCGNSTGAGASFFDVPAGRPSFDAWVYAGSLDASWGGSVGVDDGYCTIMQLVC